MKTLAIISTTALITLLLLVAFGLAYEKDTQTTQSSGTPQDEAIPESASKDMFMDGCNSDNEATAYCECVWNGLRDDYSVEQLQTRVQGRTDRELEQFIMPYARNCVHLLNRSVN